MSSNYNPIDKVFTIDEGTTDGAIRELRELITLKKVIPEDFLVATLRYNAHNGLGAKGTSDFYPLKFISGEDEVWVSSVNAGYEGRGPHGTLEALELMGFNISERVKTIVLGKKVTNELFIK